jgi:hypothetical protein
VETQRILAQWGSSAIDSKGGQRRPDFRRAFWIYKMFRHHYNFVTFVLPSDTFHALPAGGIQTLRLAACHFGVGSAESS